MTYLKTPGTLFHSKFEFNFRFYKRGRTKFYVLPVGIGRAIQIIPLCRSLVRSIYEFGLLYTFGNMAC